MPLHPTDTDALIASTEAYILANRAHNAAPSDMTAARLQRAHDTLIDTATNYVKPIAPTLDLIERTYWKGHDDGTIATIRAINNNQSTVSFTSKLDGRPLR